MTTTPSPDVPDADIDDAPQANDTQSWDDFWAEIQRAELDERGAAATETIRGVTVAVPHDMPMRFTQRLEQLHDSSSEDDTRELLIQLFGADVYDAWIEAGMTTLEFQTVLAWGIARGQGHELTFREAYDVIKSRGKVVPPTAGPARKRAGSGGSGGRSRRTSAGSTTSRRKK